MAWATLSPLNHRKRIEITKEKKWIDIIDWPELGRTCACFVHLQERFLLHGRRRFVDEGRQQEFWHSLGWGECLRQLQITNKEPIKKVNSNNNTNKNKNIQNFFEMQPCSTNRHPCTLCSPTYQVYNPGLHRLTNNQTNPKLVGRADKPWDNLEKLIVNHSVNCIYTRLTRGKLAGDVSRRWIRMWIQQDRITVSSLAGFVFLTPEFNSTSK